MASPATASNRAWANPVIHSTIAQHCTYAALYKIIQLNKEAFKIGAQALYRSILDYGKFEEMLGGLRSSARHKIYSASVSHISKVGATADIQLLNLIARYPQLRSATSRLPEVSYAWKLDPCRVNARIICTVEGWDTLEEWKTNVTMVRTAVPVEWTLRIRPKSVLLKNAARVDRWIASVERGEVDLPKEIIIQALDRGTHGKLSTFAASLSPSETVNHLHFDVHMVGEVVDPVSNMTLVETMLDAWSGIVETVDVHHRWLAALRLGRLQARLLNYRQITFGVPIEFDEADTLAWVDHCSAAKGSIPMHHSIDFKVYIHPRSLLEHCSSLAGLPDESASIRSWIRNLARLLLALSGPRGRHSIIMRGGRVKSEDDLLRATKRCNILLQEVIATIIETRCESIPRGYRRLELAERRGTSDEQVELESYCTPTSPESLVR